MKDNYFFLTYVTEFNDKGEFLIIAKNITEAEDYFYQVKNNVEFDDGNVCAQCV